MVKDKTTKPSKELPLGFVDRKEKELLIRDFVISNIKEVMILRISISEIKNSHRVHAEHLLGL